MRLVIIFWLLIGQNLLAYPLRIMSASLASDEVLVELFSNNPQMMKRLIAVSYLADSTKYSLITHRVQSIQNRFTVNIENTLKLKPDLLILSSFNEAKYKKNISDFKIPYVELSSFKSIKDIEKNITEIGFLVGMSKESILMIESLRKNLQQIRTAIQIRCGAGVPKILVYSEHNTIPARETLIDDVIKNIGLDNALIDPNYSGWKKYNEEFIAKLDVDYVIIPLNVSTQHIQRQPGWSRLRAVRESRWVFVPESLLSTVSQNIQSLAAVIGGQVCFK